MPSSSARCAQLPRAADKVPFYAALKKFRDYLNGVIPHIDESECVFADPKTKSNYENDSIKADLSISRFTPNSNSIGILGSSISDMMQHHPSDLTDISNSMLSGKCDDMSDMVIFLSQLSQSENKFLKMYDLNDYFSKNNTRIHFK